MQYSESDWIDKSKGKQMPGIASDGSEDLPNVFDPNALGFCPYCYEVATAVAKDMVGTHHCRNGHKWERAYSMLAVSGSARSRKAPPENCLYGACPKCLEPGISRARDMVGTTYCKNGHTFSAAEAITKTEQKPIATEQKPVYDSPTQGENVKLTNHIKDVVEKAAHQAREDAAYGGSHSDGGAGQKLERLKYWLDGIEYAKTGKTTVYKSVLTDFERATDPDYQTYLRLQEKFGK